MPTTCSSAQRETPMAKAQRPRWPKFGYCRMLNASQAQGRKNCSSSRLLGHHMLEYSGACHKPDTIRTPQYATNHKSDTGMNRKQTLGRDSIERKKRPWIALSTP